MKKVVLSAFSLFFVIAGFNAIANAQQGGGVQIEDMQKTMMQQMQQQMMQNMGSGGGMGGGMAPQQSSGASVPQAKAAAGAAVFADASLGTTGKSCKTCHTKPGQKPLDGRKVSAHLIAFIQYCYNNALKGPGIMAENKLNGLVDYFTSLQR